MAAENRLTADQLAALAPGDVVTIESGQEFGRRRHCTGTVGRVNGSYLTVSSEGPRGGKFVERYSLRDGFRIGRGTRAELVSPQTDDTTARDLLVRQTRQIDVLYRGNVPREASSGDDVTRRSSPVHLPHGWCC